MVASYRVNTLFEGVFLILMSRQWPLARVRTRWQPLNGAQGTSSRLSPGENLQAFIFSLHVKSKFLDNNMSLDEILTTHHDNISKFCYEFFPQMGEGRLCAGEAEQGLGNGFLGVQPGADLSLVYGETQDLSLVSSFL